MAHFVLTNLPAVGQKYLPNYHIFEMVLLLDAFEVDKNVADEDKTHGYPTAVLESFAEAFDVDFDDLAAFVEDEGHYAWCRALNITGSYDERHGIQTILENGLTFLRGHASFCTPVPYIHADFCNALLRGHMYQGETYDDKKRKEALTRVRKGYGFFYKLLEQFGDADEGTPKYQTAVIHADLDRLAPVAMEA